MKNISKTATALVDALADRFGVPAEQILGDRREKRFCWPRHLCAWALYSRGFSQADIAGFFQKDHATISHACANVIHTCNRHADKRDDASTAALTLAKIMKEIEIAGVAHGPKEQSEILVAIGELRNDIRDLRTELRRKK